MSRPASPLRYVLSGLLFAAGLSAPAQAASESAWSRNDHASVRLVSAVEATGSAETLRVGLAFDLAPGWKIYWRSPGDAGFPPRVDWSGSQNLDSAALRWPAPVRFELFGLDTFGYGGEIVLPIDVRPARAGEAVDLRATVDYLVCETICIPYQAELALALPAGPATPSAHAHAIDRFVSRVPGDGAASGLSIERVEWNGGDRPQLSISVRSVMPLAAPDAFVEGPQGWSFGKPAAALSDGGRQAVLRVPARRESAPPGSDLAGESLTITIADGERAAERRLEVAIGPASSGAAASLLGVLALAVLGGLILNLMPCVLPVLSIKLLNVVSHGGAARSAIRANFLSSAAGIVAAFLVLAAALVALKASGHAIGWGIQFQQPVFLIFMALLLTLFAANLWGWFEIRLPYSFATALERVPGGKPDERESRSAAFLTGAFATLLATPCSAPFLGTAVGFALASGPAEIFAVFAALGVGLALPYLLVAIFPALAQRLPKPGRWMIGLRRVLGVALLGTAAWLLTVLVAQIGWHGAAALAALLTLMFGFLWIVRESGDSRRRLRMAGLAGFAAVAFLVPGRFAAEPLSESAAVPGWQAWDRAAIDRLVGAGQVVFVDVTADWCITCQVNKALVLTRDPVAPRLAGEGGVVPMRADWTRPDPRIAEYLASFGRYGIPFNVVYGPAAPQGIALPELLTADAVLDAFDRASGRSHASAPAGR